MIKKYDPDELRALSQKMTELAGGFEATMNQIGAVRVGGEFGELSEATWEFGKRWSYVTEERTEQMRSVGQILNGIADQLSEFDQSNADALRAVPANAPQAMTPTSKPQAI